MSGTIAAVLGVKDEVDLIGLSIAHLRRIGVDHICVVDYGSTDGTLDIVASECRRHRDVLLTHIDPDIGGDYEAQSAHDLALASRTGAEWVLVLDADEFWLPSTGTLRTCGAMDGADIVVAQRYNVPLTAAGAMLPEVPTPDTYGTLPLLTRRVAHFKQFLEAHPEEPFITVVPGHKVMGRLSHAAAITPGGHDLRPALPDTRRHVASHVVVAHVAFSSWSRFVCKVDNIRAEIVRHPALFAGDCAWHWRRWAELGERELRQEYERQVATDLDLVTWANAGFLHTAADLLGLRVPGAVASLRS